MILLCFSQMMMAQNTEIVVIYADMNTKKQVFNMDKETKSLTLTEKTSTTIDSYFDAFIIKPSIEHPNAVYIVSANENNLFLKRNGDSLEFKDIQQEDTVYDRANYEWEIQYFGFPFITINDPDNFQKVIYTENNTLMMKEVPAANWNLSDNSDPKGNAYRYKITKISNTF